MKMTLYPLTRLNQWQLFQMMEDILQFSNKHGENMPPAFYEKREIVQAAFNVYDEVMAQETSISAKRQIQIDEERNYVLRKMYQIIHAYSDYKFSPKKEASARALLRTLKFYGSGRTIARMSQDTKTAITTIMLQDLAKEESVPHLAALDLTDVIAALAKINKEFIKEQALRLNKQANFVTGVAKSARAELQTQFLEFATLINALAVVEGEQKYALLKQTIGATVQKHVKQAQQRIGKNEKPQEEQP